MTLKRLILSILTLVVVLLVGSSLVKSWNEPQISSRLQLYQTDLLLTASELQQSSSGVSASEFASASKAILGEDPIASSLEEYQSVRRSAETNLKKFQTQLAQPAAPVTPTPTTVSPPAPGAADRTEEIRKAIAQQQDLINQLELRIGILQTQKDQTDSALKTWKTLVERSQFAAASAREPSAASSAISNATPKATPAAVAQTATVLEGLWSEPPRLLPNAEEQLQQHLDGWFRYAALTQLYQLQQRPDASSELQSAAQETAQQTLIKLALVSTVPILGCLAGATLLIFVLIQRLTQGKQAILAQNQAIAWDVPWDWEIVWQVLIVGFFLMGQVVLPILLSPLSDSFAAFGSRSKAIFSLTFYSLMAVSALLVLYLSIKRFLPLPAGWFQFKGGHWLLWGLGGYLAALPLMIGISLINEQFWQGQGGSNPLLQIVLEEGDKVSLAIFLFTAAIAAPIFEETLFRGFLLPSLTRYLPVWGAIALSSLVFAIAHLSLSEVLPLTVLGAMLGFVYTRSRNLLSSMLLHSLWNSVTMVALFILGSGA